MKSVWILVKNRAFFSSTHAPRIRSTTATVNIDIRRRDVRPRIRNIKGKRKKENYFMKIEFDHILLVPYGIYEKYKRKNV